MSLSRRVAWLLAALLLVVMSAGMAIHTLAMRQALQAELQLRNHEGAQLLAATLAPLAGDAQAMRAAIQAPLHLGGVGRVQVVRPDGELILDASTTLPATRAPRWFVRLLPLAPSVGEAFLPAAGTLRLESRAAWVHDSLWETTLAALQLWVFLGLAAAGLAAWFLNTWRKPLQATVAQARSLEQGQFVEAEEPGLSELRSLTRSMNAVVRRQRDLFAAQAEQVQVLQRQAQLDGVTALPLRRHFMDWLDAQLSTSGGPGATLILLRVLELGALTHRLGHEATDRLLASVAGLLQAYLDSVPGTFAGRLNGSDFALCLPVAGLATETAGSLHAALVAAPALHAGGAQIVIGAVDCLGGLTGGPALAAADAALARAESEGGLAVHSQGQAPADLAGSRVWREQISAALAEGRIQLVESSVLGPGATLLHLECELRVQFTPGGDFHGAERWLALARRSRLLPDVDLAALALALAAIAADGQPRAVHMGLPSLSTPGFVADVVDLLQDAPTAAQRLSIEWVGPGSLEQDYPLVPIAAQEWRSCGVHLGVELSGAQVQHITRLSGFGIEYFKLEASNLRGVAGVDSVRAYAQGLVALAHGLGMAVLAQGVDSAEDLAALWAMGFDGAAGPALPGVGAQPS